MGLDSGRDPHENPGTVRSPGRRIEEAAEAGDLVERVDDDATDAARQRGRQLLFGLVVAVQDKLLGGHTGGERHVQLAAGGHIEVHALFPG